MSTTLFTRIAHVARTAAVATVIAGAAIGAAGAAHATPLPEITFTKMYGDPDAAAEYWQMQTLPDDCVLMSVADVVGELTEDLPSEDEIIEVAGDTPSSDRSRGTVYLPSQTDDTWGTLYRDAVKLLARYGINAYYADDNVQSKTTDKSGMEALLEELGDGEKVIVGLNGPTIWSESGDRTEAAHAVVVTGVDITNGIVHLNDSYPANGANWQVPLATFERAWQTGPHIMVVTDEAA